MLIWEVADGNFYSINHHCNSIVLGVHVDITVEIGIHVLIIVNFQIQIFSLSFWDNSHNLDINTGCFYMSAILTLMWFCSCVWSLFSRTMNLSSGVQS